MEANAIILSEPGKLSLDTLALCDPGPGDIVVDVHHSGISTGTERLFWDGRMPEFPGMGYPLVPGYESAGEVVEAGAETPFKPGDHVFVPGAACYRDARGLFGGAASRIVSPAARAVKTDPTLGASAALLALAATARHAMAGVHRAPPELIVGHGVLGRLLARLTLACGAPAPIVWETDPARRGDTSDYEVCAPEDDPRHDYTSIYDASGAPGILDTLMPRLSKGGEIVLAGFYSSDVCFAFPPAFMREARFRIAAEWTEADLIATRALVDANALSLAGLISHRRESTDAHKAYPQAFNDPACLKMILDWKDAA